MESTPNNKSDKKGKLREFLISTWSVNNQISIFLLTAMIFIFGIVGYRSIAKEQFPEVEWPQVYINTPYFGNSAEEIESLVTRPLEREIQSVDGVKNINSTSIQDFSVITVEFEADEDIDEAVRKVKDAVDIAKSELPNDLDQDPTVLEINFSEIPIVSVNVSGDYGPDQLRKYAEYIQEELEDIKEVSEVQLSGSTEREVKVDLDVLKMESLEISYGDIENAIAGENMTMSAGELLNNDFRRAIRVVGQFEAIEELRNLVVKNERQSPVYLRDIAEVRFDFKDKTSIARSDGLPVISLGVIKKKGENLLFVADQISATVEEVRETLPENLKISLFNDQSINTRLQVQNLENSIISGVILVVLVLLFFLGLRNASFVGIAIPLSMLMGILILYATGTTMNVVVLFALILALGLLVDNGIVVVENIYRYMQEGYSPTDAAKYGAGEVALPIIASTATTLAAFLPLGFWPGLVGEFMFYMPYTLIIVLSSSLFVALVINPVLTAAFMRLDEKAEDQQARRKKVRNIIITALVCFVIAAVGMVTGIELVRNLFALIGIVTLANFFLLRPGSFYFQNRIMPALERVYNKFIHFALRFSGFFFGGTVVLFILAVLAFGRFTPEITQFPQADPVYVNAFIELPLGSDIEATNRAVEQMEERISESMKPYTHIIEAILTQIGENTADPNAPPEGGNSPNKARITVQFVPTEERGGISTFDVMNEIRDAVQGVPGVKIAVDKNADGPPTQKPINIELRSDEIEPLIVEGEKVIDYINNLGIGGIEELKADVQIGKPELLVNIDREAARTYGISTFQIASAIRTAVFGKEVSQYKEGEDEYPIFIRLDEKYRYNVTNLLNQRITFRNNQGQLLQVPITAVADVEYTSTYSSIKRRNLDRTVTIFSNVVAGYDKNAIVNEVRAAMDRYDLPEGMNYEFRGEQEDQAEAMSFLAGAFAIAVFGIMIILVTQFNSVISPFIIILTVFFSLIGVLFGYAFTGKEISVVFTGVGIVSLAGIVVNNAIVLIDYINLLLQRAEEKAGVSNMLQLKKEEVREAIIQGGATRLRPVLLTAITTVLGLIPLAIGFNMNFFTLLSQSDPQIFIGGDNTAFWGPMAWTVIYGLTFATFLTLVVVPVMYWLGYRMKYFFSGERRKARRAQQGDLSGVLDA
ncbi:MAG: efflux RND transporter permease subunit [Bacteroidota bacterium]